MKNAESGRGLRRARTSGRHGGRELRAFAGRSCGFVEAANSEFKIQDSKLDEVAELAWGCLLIRGAARIGPRPFVSLTAPKILRLSKTQINLALPSIYSYLCFCKNRFCSLPKKVCAEPLGAITRERHLYRSRKKVKIVFAAAHTFLFYANSARRKETNRPTIPIKYARHAAPVSPKKHYLCKWIVLVKPIRHIERGVMLIL